MGDIYTGDYVKKGDTIVLLDYETEVLRLLGDTLIIGKYDFLYSIEKDSVVATNFELGFCK